MNRQYDIYLGGKVKKALDMQKELERCGVDSVSVGLTRYEGSCILFSKEQISKDNLENITKILIAK